MHVVRHHNVGVERHISEMVRDGLPTPVRYLAECGQSHLPVNDIAQQARPILHANRHKVHPGSRVVISPETDRPSMMEFAIIGHVMIDLLATRVLRLSW